MDKKKPTSSGKAPDFKKRKDPPSGAGNSNNHQPGGRPGRGGSKRVKFQDARNIRSQPPEAALEDGKLDLQKFLNAREFEIKALESSMYKCKAANSTRSFQQVPRAMRRRTASHNVKRIPKRLRERAKREQIEDNTPTVDAKKRRPRTTRARIRAEAAERLYALAKKKKKRLQEKASAGGVASEASKVKDGLTTKIQTRPARPKIRRNALNEPPKQESKFRKRQVHKRWLPTHLWHAKRATMTKPNNPLWRFAIPLTSTAKCYRPTHRASGQTGAVVWDMSYMSTIGLYGTAVGIERVFRAVGLTQEGLWGNRGNKWRTGTRTWTGTLSKQRKDSIRQVGPATIFWNPEAPREDVDMEGSDAPKKSRREVFIRTHPSCFLELFNELLKLVKMQSPQLHIEDLRYEIGSIELTGPGSTEALLGILEPYYNKTDTEECQAHVFRSLVGVTNPAALPKNALLAFSVRDPRLAYPPKKIDLSGANMNSSLVETLIKWPVEEGLKPFGLFDRVSRFSASRLPPQKSINRRKGAGIPGKTPQATATDPPIPVVLLASRPAAGGHTQGTWTLLAPWKCILPMWYSLMHYPLSTGGNPRLGGLDEVRQVAFEQGAPWFPGDFPGTEAGYEWEVAERLKRRHERDRRPKGKKVAWESLNLGAGRKGEIGDGLSCDFEYMFGLPKDTRSEAEGADAGNSEPAQADTPAGSVIRQVSKASFNAMLASSEIGKPPAHSIITVQLALVGRGVAKSCARIYRLPSRASNSPQTETDAETEVPSTLPPSPNSASLPSDLRDQWLRQLPSKQTYANKNTRSAPRMPAGASLETRKALLAKSILTTNLTYAQAPANQLDMGGYPFCPGEEDLIGFVTTGSFSLSEGKGSAIVSISAEKSLDTLRATGEREGRLCIVRNAGESVGWLAHWEIV